MATANGRQGSWARRFWLLRAAVGVALAACSDQGSSHSTEAESLGTSAQALTAVQTRILGFESTADWATTAGSLSLSSNHIEGAKSLAVANSGNAVISSVPISSLGAVGDKLTLDLLLPVAQPNPYWMGTLQLVLESPSLGLWYEALQQYQLQGRPTNQFLRFDFPLSAATRAKLSTGTYSDLRVRVLLNVPQGAGPWLLDRLSVGSSGGGGSGGAGGSGGTSGSSGTAGSSGKGGTGGAAGGGTSGASEELPAAEAAAPRATAAPRVTAAPRAAPERR